MQDEYAIQISDLRKSYRPNTAVDGVSFNVRKGHVFGLLGPNGAGKSTTINMMCGLLRSDSGTVRIGADGDPADSQTRRQLGLAPQSLAVYEKLTAEENLRFFAQIYGLGGKSLAERIDWALGLAGLTDRRGDVVEKYSGGMKRRLNLACALVHAPKIVFLDEPTVGVDPQSRNYIFESVERLKGEGLTVVYTTHYMEEAQRLCDEVAIMDQGKILAMDNVPNLIESYGGESVILAEFDKPPLGLDKLGGEIDDNKYKLHSKDPFEDLARIAQSGNAMRSLRLERADLESVFLALTGRTLRD